VPDFQTRLWTMRPDGGDAGPLPMREPGFDVEPKYSPDGRWIVFSRLRRVGDEELSALFLVGAKGGKAGQLTSFSGPPSYVEHPTWSPDSRWILFNLSPDGTIQAIRADGARTRVYSPSLPPTTRGHLRHARQRLQGRQPHQHAVDVRKLPELGTPPVRDNAAVQ
jgi:Tol biopolymer transport system component